MTLRENIASIRNGHIEPVYFLNGDDYFLQTFFIEEIIKELSSDQLIEKNFFSGES